MKPLYQERISLQNKLGYHFENIFILHEALTHSYNEADEHFPNCGVKFRKKTFHRLELLGESVLQLASSEYAICAGKAIKNWEVSTLKSIALSTISLKQISSVGSSLGLSSCIEVDTFTSGQVGWKISNLFGNAVKALFGAVFVDGGGSEGNGFAHVYTMFTRLWQDYLFRIHSWGDSVSDNFLPNKGNLVFELLSRGRKHGLKIENLSELESRLKYKFKKIHFLEQAITHESVQQIEKLEKMGTHEQYGFLGEALIHLIIVECGFWKYVNDEKCSIVKKILSQNLVNDLLLQKIGSDIELEKFVRKPYDVKIVSGDVHIFVKSVIGAVRIDSGSLSESKEVFKNICEGTVVGGFLGKLKNSEISKILYAKRTYYGSSAIKISRWFGDIVLPEKQKGVKILNLNTFLAQWQDTSESLEIHMKRFHKAVEDEAMEEKVEKEYSEEKCNRLEFVRLGVYREAGRMFLNKEREPGLITQIVSAFIWLGSLGIAYWIYQKYS